MTHYHEQELEKALEEIKTKNKLLKGQYASALTYGDFIDEPEDYTHVPKETIVDLLAHDASKDIDDYLELEALKQTKGKPEGARYCYIGEHSVLNNKNQYFALEGVLKSLVEAIDDKAYFSARHIVEVGLQAVRDLDDEFLTNLVTVRAHALSTGKYSVSSYREKIDINLLLDAVARHLLKIIYISDIDEESGVHHLGHIAANLIMIDVQLRLYHGSSHAS